jgi:hypothetical protein
MIQKKKHSEGAAEPWSAELGASEASANAARNGEHPSIIYIFGESP